MMLNVMTGLTEAMMQNIVRGGGHDESTGRWVLERIKLPHTIASKKITPGKKVLQRKSKESKSTEQLLSVVN
jgi:hypothetical protein